MGRRWARRPSWRPGYPRFITWICWRGVGPGCREKKYYYIIFKQIIFFEKSFLGVFHPVQNLLFNFYHPVQNLFSYFPPWFSKNSYRTLKIALKINGVEEDYIQGGEDFWSRWKRFHQGGRAIQKRFYIRVEDYTGWRKIWSEVVEDSAVWGLTNPSPLPGNISRNRRG